MGYTKEPVATLDKEWQHHRREVRRLHEKLFYRPLLTAVARLAGDEARLTPEAATRAAGRARLRDPTAALRHLEALTSGVTRTREHPAAAAAGDAGLVRRGAGPRRGAVRLPQAERVAGAHARGTCKTLRDEGQVAERLAKLLATSRYVSDLLEKEPAGVRMLGEDLAPLEAEQYNELVVEEMLAAGGRRDDPEAAVRAIRAVRRRELFRVAAGDTLGLIDVADVGAALSRITDATLEATLQVVLASVAHAKGRGPAGRGSR